MTQINTREKARLKDRAFSFAQKEALTMPEIILSDYFCGDESVEEICEDMTCGRDKAMKRLAELDTKKGVGLIERIKQGQGKPTKIYVKRFTTRTAPPKPAPPPPEPFAPISQVDFSNVQKSEIPTPRGGKNRRAAVEKTDPNYTKRIQTELIQPDPSISPRKPPASELRIDRYERRKEG
ncbi:hypothetical protein [uncultured Oscillibacter sp.]|uniref:hypothetical protein n=1 Tax=uncultured Oscillibacter sp. TaxID=876091 RepID=UPI0026371DB9|nr:hypothetical protein [uncultured Oscillibacter sp.]